MRLEIHGGRIYDPTNGVDGEVRSIFVEDGKVVEAPNEGRDLSLDRRLNANGCVVMPGGVDIHSHIAGAAVNRARRLILEEKALASVRPVQRLRGGTGGAVPSTFTTGYRYARLGYTTAVEAAVLPGGARQCHLELEDTPCLDKAILLVLSDHPLILDAMRGGETRGLEDIARQLLCESGAFGIKAVNPGGAAHWRRRRGMVEGLDHKVAGGPTPRQILCQLAQLKETLNLPHPLHVHGNRLGVAGNIQTTVQTVKALKGQRAHLAHVQFHAYGKNRRRGGPELTSGATELVDALSETPTITADVGAVYFGAAVTLTTDRPVEHDLWQRTGARWVNVDSELEGGCGVLPLRYRPRSEVHGLQWALGLELLLLSADPWRLVLSTDHPNGASFLVYPRLIAALMDQNFRREEIRRVSRGALASTVLGNAGIDREYTLGEIAIITRAAPARILGLAHKGHLGPGADADITVYEDDPDRVRMFESPRWVIKSGEVVVEDGELKTPIQGTSYRAALDTDIATANELLSWRQLHSTVDPAQVGLLEEELKVIKRVSGS